MITHWLSVPTCALEKTNDIYSHDKSKVDCTACLRLMEKEKNFAQRVARSCANCKNHAGWHDNMWCNKHSDLATSSDLICDDYE